MKPRGGRRLWSAAALAQGLKIRVLIRLEGVMGRSPVGVTLGALSRYFPRDEVESILLEQGKEGVRRRKLPSVELMYYLIALGLNAGPKG
jgi:hypothetical protein